MLSYFSLIECIAQDVANYPITHQQEVFTSFVLKYQNICSFLENVDPITLYYRKEELLGELDLFNNLVDGSVYTPQDLTIRKMANKIEKTLISVLGEEKAQRYLRNHRYVDLLYRMRCGLSHEFSSSHIANSKIAREPYYICCSRLYLKEEKITEDNVWTLNVPLEFIKNLCENCINNYLDDCIKNNVLPLPNNTMNRLSELSWYNKL